MMNLWLAQAQAPAGPPLQPLPHPDLPQVFLPPAPVPVWVYLLAALLLVSLLTLVLWLLLRPRQPSPPAPKKPWSIAMNALKNLLPQAASQPPGQTSAEVSEILRRYFFDRYNIPAPFRTTREIFESTETPPASPRLMKYASLAALWDELSFAPVPSSSQAAQALVEKAIGYLEEDRP